MADKEDKKEDSIAVKNDDLDLDFEAKSRSTDKIPSVNILGTNIKLDLLTGVSLLLGVIGAAGAGYMWYDNYNRNKAIEEQRRQQEADQKHQDMVNEMALRRRMVTPRPPPRYTPTHNNNDMVDMNSIGGIDDGGLPDPMHPSRYVGPAVPDVDYDKLLNANNNRNSPPSFRSTTNAYQAAPIASNDVPVVNMNIYRDEQQPPTQYPIEEQPQPQQRPQRDPTPDELYASMNGNGEETGGNGDDQYYNQ